MAGTAWARARTTSQSSRVMASSAEPPERTLLAKDCASSLLQTARDELIAANGEDDDRVAHVLTELEQLAAERSAAPR